MKDFMLIKYKSIGDKKTSRKGLVLVVIFKIVYYLLIFRVDDAAGESA